MKRIFAAYKDLLGVMLAEAPILVVLTLVSAVVTGFLAPLGVFVNQNVFDGGLAVARGEISFPHYAVFLARFVVVALLPSAVDGIVWNYVEPQSTLIMRTVYRDRLLRKLKTMKYEHFENEATAEVIDKAFNRVHNAVRHLFPMYLFNWITAVIASAGLLFYLFSIRWWLVLTVLGPFALQTYFSSKNSYNIYNEMETYWKRERKYGILGGFLRSRDYSKELKAYENADYLIGTYKKRLGERNRDYERYYFKNLRRILLGGNLARFASIANVLLLLLLFVNGQMSVGLFISMTGLMFGQINNYLGGCTFIFKWGPFHINTYDYYDRFFRLSDDAAGSETVLPESFGIEFRDVWFRYPGTERDVLKGLSFTVKSGEKASIVGENGEGKSTMIKLLLGLYQPDRGEILVGGKNLDAYPLAVRTKMFGPVFQDFPRYSITLGENIGIGDISELKNGEKIRAAAKKGRADVFAEKFEKGYDTQLGRDFEGGVDLSGGEWQRIAMSRAFMGDKPILLLDEPTSQLDPMAEAGLYREFSGMAANKTALFITHRLGSTMITDRIFVISGGKIDEAGTHGELMATGGLYARMFNAQKQWYDMGGAEAEGEMRA